MTLAELEAKLAERELSLTVHILGQGPAWIVWLFASDDPALGTFVGEGGTLELAIAKALDQWDGAPGALREPAIAKAGN